MESIVFFLLRFFYSDFETFHVQIGFRIWSKEFDATIHPEILYMHKLWNNKAL